MNFVVGCKANVFIHLGAMSKTQPFLLKFLVISLSLGLATSCASLLDSITAPKGKCETFGRSLALLGGFRFSTDEKEMKVTSERLRKLANSMESYDIGDEAYQKRLVKSLNHYADLSGRVAAGENILEDEEFDVNAIDVTVASDGKPILHKLCPGR